MTNFDKPTNPLDWKEGIVTSFYNIGERTLIAPVPKYSDIPDEIKSLFLQSPCRDKFRKFQSNWFFKGLKKCNLIVKDGINEKDAMFHLSNIQKNNNLKHEHKVAAFVFLCHKWLDDVEYEVCDEA